MSGLLSVRGTARDNFALSADDLDEDDELDGEVWDDGDEDDWDDDEWDDGDEDDWDDEPDL